MRIAVLAVQGAFIEHEKMLEKLNISSFELRNSHDLEQSYDGIILPGGESTVQGKLLRELHMYDNLKEQINHGMPVLATCAGMILLASKVEGECSAHLGTLPISVRRNAYGRQLGSFYTAAPVAHIGTVPMTFIRAPYVCEVFHGTEVIAAVEDHIVAVKYHHQMAFAFHPELNEDLRIHRAFLDICHKNK
ncbi:MAG: pyridoxal 5'-phosphate synthase glutaminase subunit PdxT [Lachnospiraceae bacterium]